MLFNTLKEIMAKERGKKELDLQEELSKAKSKLENNPNDHNTTY